MIWLWIGFVVFVLGVLALDLFVFNRGIHKIPVRRALAFVALFIAMGAAFNGAVYFIYKHDWMGIGTRFAQLAMDQATPHSPHTLGMTAATQFLAGWLTEYSLSVDNLFVIALIFTYFRVPAAYQHRVLFWGIIGALVARAAMILVGVELVERFGWTMYLFGAFLVFTGIKMALTSENDQKDFNHSLPVRLVKRLIPVSPAYDGQRFFTRIDNRLAATPLLLVLVVVESTDVIFAVDSIPAIIGITRDPFLVFTSNVFAILGLRSMFFALSALMDKFMHLKYALAAILVFVGVKMLLEGVQLVRSLFAWAFGGVPGWLSWLPEHPVHVPTGVTLGVIAGCLTLGIVASLAYASRHPKPPDSTP